MKAAQFKKPQVLEIIESPLRKLEPLEALVKIAACGVCGTDVHIFAGEAHARPPVILGHEFAGAVIEVGNQVRDARLYLQNAFLKELTILSAILNPFTFHRAVDLLAQGKINLAPFSLNRFALEKIGEALESTRKSLAVKTLVIPD